MFYLSHILRASLIVSLLPVVASAAGTYYNSTNNNRSYSSAAGYVNYRNNNANNANANGYTSYTNARYSVGTNVSQQRAPVAQQTQKQVAPSESKSGFFLDAGLNHEFANWEFEMKNAGSKLHYDNIRWNVLGIDGGYKFGNVKVPFQINAGVRYGFQFGDSSMIDDDISLGGFVQSAWKGTTSTGQAFEKYQMGHALSVGKTSGGNMLGFNAGVGLTDLFSVGGFRVTPSVGYRYLKYKLKTNDNYGMAIDTMDVSNNCVTTDGGEVQCGPLLIFFNQSGEGQPITNQAVGGVKLLDVDNDGYADVAGVLVSPGANYVSTENTYYYAQSGTSHDYDVVWSGPYVALDMDYEMNKNNNANIRLELGLPGYDATGDQPYRPDWQHPKSVEDKASMFSGLHLGAGANWTTAITDSIALSIGVTYDYYHVGSADATTYLNPTYYTAVYDAQLAAWKNLPGMDPNEAEYYMLHGGFTDSAGNSYDADSVALYINDAKNNGWSVKDSGETKSFYKSLGVHLGVAARF
ncbi:MAG: hypothetical protein ACLRFJ_02565 [Alphaproteobacteria bacterium]